MRRPVGLSSQSEQELGWALPFPPGFYIADTYGRKPLAESALSPVCGIGIFHLWASKCPQIWLQVYCHELNYPVQVSFHVSPALLFTYFTLTLLLHCASPRELQTCNWARPKAGKVTSRWGDIPLHPWSPNPSLQKTYLLAEGSTCTCCTHSPEPFLIFRRQ